MNTGCYACYGAACGGLLGLVISLLANVPFFSMLGNLALFVAYGLLAGWLMRRFYDLAVREQFSRRIGEHDQVL